MRITENQMVYFEDVKKGVDSALNDLRRFDLQLLELCADERSATHRVACYLQQYFPDWHVDCEYNRKHGETKKLHGKIIRPDIVVHKRNSAERNLVCIEVKKSGDPISEINKDRKKLRGLTLIPGEYNYQYGLLMIFSLVHPYTIQFEWYRKGNVCESSDYRME